MELLSISNLALERARGLSPDLARVGDDEARAVIHRAVDSGTQREESLDQHGAPQTLVWLGQVSCSRPRISCADMGVAIIKGATVVTILDTGGARQIRARALSRLPAPALEPIAGAPGVHRFRVSGWPGVESIDVMADGTGRVHLLRP